MARTRPPFPLPVLPAMPQLEGLASVCREPVLILDLQGGLAAANAPAELLLGRGLLPGRKVDELLNPGGYVFEGQDLSAVIRAGLKKDPAQVFRMLVRKVGEEVDRVALIRGLMDDQRKLAGYLVTFDGGTAREDLTQLRAKAREVAHSLNNVVMTAIGNVSLARMVAAKAPEEAMRHLDAAERNLLQVRDLTRDLQTMAKRDLPSA